MFRKHLAFRRERGLDAMAADGMLPRWLSEAKLPDLPSLKAAYPHIHHKVDRRVKHSVDVAQGSRIAHRGSAASADSNGAAFDPCRAAPRPPRSVWRM